MEYLGLALLGVGLLAGIWWLSRKVTHTARNDDPTHGGGTGGTPPGVM